MLNDLKVKGIFSCLSISAYPAFEHNMQLYSRRRKLYLRVVPSCNQCIIQKPIKLYGIIRIEVPRFAICRE